MCLCFSWSFHFYIYIKQLLFIFFARDEHIISVNEPMMEPLDAGNLKAGCGMNRTSII